MQKMISNAKKIIHEIYLEKQNKCFEVLTENVVSKDNEYD